jgi:hypothetical protein
MTEPEAIDAGAAEPEPEADALARAETEAAAEAAAVAPESAEPGAGDVLTSNDYTVAFSPRQVAVGLAIVAGLIALVAARRRRRTPAGTDA